MAASYSEYERARELGRARGDLARELEDKQTRRILEAYAGNNASSERIAAMNYGVGGAQDRELASRTGIAQMQFGPGGMGDRELAAKAPLITAQAGNLSYETELGRKKEPDILRQLGLTTDAAEKILPFRVDEARLGNEFMKGELGLGKKSPVSSLTAKPTQPSSFLNVEDEVDKAYEEFKPYKLRPLDWLTRRGLNFMNAPSRVMNYLRYE